MDKLNYGCGDDLPMAFSHNSPSLAITLLLAPRLSHDGFTEEMEDMLRQAAATEPLTLKRLDELNREGVFREAGFTVRQLTRKVRNMGLPYDVGGVS